MKALLRVCAGAHVAHASPFWRGVDKSSNHVSACMQLLEPYIDRLSHGSAERPLRVCKGTFIVYPN